MVDFSVRYKGEGMKSYLQTIEENVKRTPFMNAKVFISEDMAFIHIRPLIFPFHYFAPMIWIFGFLITGGFNLVVMGIGMIPGFMYLFYNKYFYVMMLYIGKRKNNVMGSFKLL